MLMQTVFLFSLVSLIYFHPWRLRYANLLDFTLTGAMLILISFSAFAVDQSESDLEAMSWAGTFFLVGLGMPIPFAILYGICVRCAPRAGNQFEFFLCHHKAHAGAFARLLKVSLLGTRKL